MLGKKEKLHHQNYDGKRVSISISDTIKILIINLKNTLNINGDNKSHIYSYFTYNKVYV